MIAQILCVVSLFAMIIISDVADAKVRLLCLIQFYYDEVKEVLANP